MEKKSLQPQPDEPKFEIAKNRIELIILISKINQVAMQDADIHYCMDFQDTFFAEIPLITSRILHDQINCLDLNQNQAKIRNDFGICETIDKSQHLRMKTSTISNVELISVLLSIDAIHFG